MLAIFPRFFEVLNGSTLAVAALVGLGMAASLVVSAKKAGSIRN